MIRLIPMFMSLFLVSPHAQAQTQTQGRRYAVGALQSLDYSPSPGNNRPWVVTIHGGSWAHGDKADPPMLAARKAFLGIGVTVFSLNYRLSPQADFAGIKSDIDSAFAYIKTRARYYRINRHRGLVYGHSAGGHLAAVLGLEGNGGRGIRGIITTSRVLAPPRTVNPQLMAHERALMHGPVGSTWAPFLPQNYLSAGDPPILSFHGED